MEWDNAANSLCMSVLKETIIEDLVLYNQIDPNRQI